MSSHMTYAAQGISHLVVEELGREAHVQGMSDGTEIDIVHQGGMGQETPQFVLEGETLTFTGAQAERVLLPATMAVTIRNTGAEGRVHDLASDVNLKIVRGDLRLVDLTGRVSVGQVDGSVRADSVADLRLAGLCSGDVRFHDGESLQAESIAGDLRLRNCGAARVDHIRGDLWAETIRDRLEIGRVDGDARLNEVQGAVVLRSLHGDLRATGMTGGLAAPEVNGDVDLEGPFAPGESYTINAQGDTGLHLASDADLRLSVRARGRVRSDVQLTPAPDGTPVFTGVVGRGASRITIECAGDLHINQNGAEYGQSAPGTPADLGDRIRQQVTASLAAAGIDVDSGETNRGRTGFGHGSRAGRQSAPSTSSRPPVPPRPSASERMHQGPSREEEMVILRMVEAGTISAEEADALLKALGASS